MIIELDKIGLNPEESIKSIANLNPIYAYEWEKISDVIEKFVSSSHRSLPVVSSEKKLKGIISITDVFDAYLSGKSFETKVRDVMTKEVITADVTDTIRFVLQKMKISNKGRLPVVSEGKVVGMVGERDYVVRVDEEVFSTVMNEEIMTKKPFFIKPETTISECLRIMTNTKYRRLPVVDKEVLKGYLTSTLLMKELWNSNFSIVDESVEKIMTKKPFTLGVKDSVKKTLKLMKERAISSMLIVDEGNKLTGIITERDIINIIY